MLKVSYLLLAIAVGSISADVIDINDTIDGEFAKENEWRSREGRTMERVHHGRINANVSFSEGVFVGLDSLIRTGDCTVDTEGSTSTIELHYGLQLWLVIFKQLRVDGVDMSASYRAHDNSVYLKFRIFNYNASDCHVAVDDFKIERFSKIEFSASRSEFDAYDVDSFFESDVVPAANKHLNYLKPRLAIIFDWKICRDHHHHHHHHHHHSDVGSDEKSVMELLNESQKLVFNN